MFETNSLFILGGLDPVDPAELKSFHLNQIHPVVTSKMIQSLFDFGLGTVKCYWRLYQKGG